MSVRVECPWCARRVKFEPDSVVMVDHIAPGNRQQARAHCPGSGRELSSSYLVKVGVF